MLGKDDVPERTPTVGKITFGAISNDAITRMDQYLADNKPLLDEYYSKNLFLRQQALRDIRAIRSGQRTQNNLEQIKKTFRHIPALLRAPKGPMRNDANFSYGFELGYMIALMLYFDIHEDDL